MEVTGASLISIPSFCPLPKNDISMGDGCGSRGVEIPAKVTRQGFEEGLRGGIWNFCRLHASQFALLFPRCSAPSQTAHAGVRPTQSCGTRGHTCQCPCSLPRRRLPWRLRPLLQRAPSAPTAAKLTVAVAVSAPAAAQPSPKAQSSASAAARPATEGRSAPAAATPWTRPPVVAETPTSRSLV